MFRHQRNLSVSAKRVCRLHRGGTLAFGGKQKRVRHQNTSATGATGRHVGPIGAVHKLHAARGIFWRRCCHGVNDDGSLLALELVYGTDSRVRKPLADGGHLATILSFSTPVVGFGTWVFDNNRASAESFTLTANGMTSLPIDNGGGTAHILDGFLGVIVSLPSRFRTPKWTPWGKPDGDV